MTRCASSRDILPWNQVWVKWRPAAQTNIDSMLQIIDSTLVQKANQNNKEVPHQPMFDTELCDVDGLPWALRRWQLFFYRGKMSWVDR